MKKLAIPFLTLAAGMAAGWFGRTHWLPPATHDKRAPVTSAVPADVAPALPAPQNSAAPVAAAEKVAAAKAKLTNFRDLLKTERNPARATVKILTMLDSMDAAAVSALAGELNSTLSDWRDNQSGVLMQLVYGKLAELNPTSALQMAMKARDQWSRVTATGAVIEQLARSNPGAAEAALEKFPPGYLRKNVIARLAGALARTDGPAAVAMMQRLKSPPNDWSWRTLYSSWAAHDPAAAAASLMTMPRQTALGYMDAIAGTWARKEPGAAMAWAQSLTEPAQRNAALRSAISAIAQDDPAQATALAATRPPGERRALLSSIASSMAQADGPGAIAWAQSLTDPLERQRCLSVVAQSTGWADTDSARQALSLLPPGAMRNEALEDVVNQISHIDPQAAKELALSLKPNEQALVMRSVIQNLAWVDIDEAEKLAASLPLSGNNAWAWESIASNKAIKDPAAALTWAGGLETEQARLAATGAVLAQWGQHSPELAAAALSGISDTNLRREATQNLASQWASRSPAEAEQWASGLSGEDRITALSAVWNASATDDPQRAARSLAAIVSAAGSETATDKLAASAAAIAGAWTGQSPSDAAAWAGSLPDGKVREEALGKVAAEWARYDPNAVSLWIDQLPHDRSRDSAIGQLVKQIANTDPESAFTWAASVGSDTKREEVLKAAASAWKAQNPDAARSAVQNADLPEDVRARVLESIR